MAPSQATGLVPWNTIQARLAGSFEARAHGLLRVFYTLTDRSGSPFAELRARDGGATLTSGDLEARIEGAPHDGYRMLSGETELLRATTLGDATVLRVECAGRAYEARVRPVRNVAVVRSRDGSETARISGGSAGRRYEAVFDAGVEGAFPVAVLVLHHEVALRRRIYLAG